MNMPVAFSTMLPTFLQSLALASAGLIAPGSITLVILLLMSNKGWLNGLSFMIGYIASYSLIGVVVLALEIGFAPNRGGPPTPTAALAMTVLGVVLLVLSISNWRTRPAAPGEHAQPSVFMQLVGEITPVKSFIIAAGFSVVNLKNFVTFIAAASVLGLSPIRLPVKLTLLIPVVLLFCTSVIIPVVIYRAFPERATEVLGSIKDWMARYGRPLLIAILLLLSFFFLSRGVGGIMHFYF